MSRASMFLKLDGIKGESMVDGHKDEIDVLSWSWGLSQSANMHRAGGGGQSVASMSDLNIVKWLDKSSPALMHSCLIGKHIAKGQFVCVKAGGNKKALNYLTMKMDEIIISSVSGGGSGSEDALTESISLNFAKVEFEYIEQTKEGGEGSKPNFSWNMKTSENSVS